MFRQGSARASAADAARSMEIIDLTGLTDDEEEEGCSTTATATTTVATTNILAGSVAPGYENGTPNRPRLSVSRPRQDRLLQGPSDGSGVTTNSEDEGSTKTAEDRVSSTDDEVVEVEGPSCCGSPSQEMGTRRRRRTPKRKLCDIQDSDEEEKQESEMSSQQGEEEGRRRRRLFLPSPASSSGANGSAQPAASTAAEETRRSSSSSLRYSSSSDDRQCSSFGSAAVPEATDTTIADSADDGRFTNCEKVETTSLRKSRRKRTKRDITYNFDMKSSAASDAVSERKRVEATTSSSSSGSLAMIDSSSTTDKIKRASHWGQNVFTAKQVRDRYKESLLVASHRLYRCYADQRVRNALSVVTTGTDGEKSNDGGPSYFPPTIFTDARYTNGILLTLELPDEHEEDDGETESSSKMKRNSAVPHDGRYFSHTSTGGSYCGYGIANKANVASSHAKDKPSFYNGECVPNAPVGTRRILPLLSKSEGTMWCHQHAAMTAVSRRYPFHAVRLLGVITLNLVEEEFAPCSAAAESDSKSTDEKGTHRNRRGGGGRSTSVKKSKAPKKKGKSRSTASSTQTSGSAASKARPRTSSHSCDRVGPFRIQDECKWDAVASHLDIYEKTGGEKNTFFGTDASRRHASANKTRLQKNITRRTAAVEATEEYEREDRIWKGADAKTEVDLAANDLNKEAVLLRRSDEIFHLWNDVQDMKPRPECWSLHDGGFLMEQLVLDDDRQDDGPADGHVSMHALTKWICDHAPVLPSKEKGESCAGAATQADAACSGKTLSSLSSAGVRRNNENGGRMTIVIDDDDDDDGGGKLCATARETEVLGAALTFGGSERGLSPSQNRRSPRELSPVGWARASSTIFTASSKGGRQTCSDPRPQVPSPAVTTGQPSETTRRPPLEVRDDRGPKATASLYSGLRRVPTDAISVVRALNDLSSPEGLYSTPLLVPYPVAHLDSVTTSNDGGGVLTRRKWTVKIGVYIHRLLPEVLTCHHLHVVMSALDEDSYRITEALHLPPEGEPVFDSSPYPIVDVSEVKDTLVVDDNDMGEKNDCEPSSRSKRTPSSSSSRIAARTNTGRSDHSVSPTAAATRDNHGSANRKTVSTSSAGLPRAQDADVEMDALLASSQREEQYISPFTPRGLLKLMENKGNNVMIWPAIDSVLSPHRLKLSMMLHQQHAVCWMVQMEHLGGFGINSILWEEREFLDGGKYYYSPALGQIRLGKPPNMKGGLLCDEMGLGKTIEVLGLILYTLDELKQEAKKANCQKRDKDRDGETGGEVIGAHGDDFLPYSHATLVIVPPALVMQWGHEIQKAVAGTVKVSVLHARSGHVELRNNSAPRHIAVPQQVLLLSDIVITTYEALVYPKSARLMSTIRWGRVVLDEMQEIRSSTTQISKNCEKLHCSRRWMLSGTPLFDGIQDLRGELNFLRLEPYGAELEDGFFDFSVAKHWEGKTRLGLETLRVLGLLMLRRSKSMTIRGTNNLPLLGLKPLTVEYVAVPQTDSERALYCWMEYIISLELAASPTFFREYKAVPTGEKNFGAKCIRLLRELCLSPVLLNGGMGAKSQLALLNNIMVHVNRREEGGRRKDKSRIKSCDGALRYLSQVQHTAQVRDDFVSEVAFGGGAGAANRTIAHDSAEQRYADAEKAVVDASKDLKEAITRRARIRWQMALEAVTTGRMSSAGMTESTSLWNQAVSLLRPQRSHATPISSKYSSLWRWRCAVTGVVERSMGEIGTLPALLTRGWRPSASFAKIGLFRSCPHFAWAHPHALAVSNIPPGISTEDIHDALEQTACRIPHAQMVRERAIKVVPLAVSASSTKHWNSIIQFADEHHMKKVALAASKSNGIVVACSKEIPEIEEAKKVAWERLEQAHSVNKVHPSRNHQQQETEAKKAYDLVARGVRIVVRDSNASTTAVLSRPLRQIRGCRPRSSSSLFSSSAINLQLLNERVMEAEQIIMRGEKTMKRLHQALNHSCGEEIIQTSAFGILESLSEGKPEHTQCPICLCPLGTERSDTKENSHAHISMTKCGHFFCAACLDLYAQERLDGSMKVPCPNCRRVFSPRSDVVYIDPSIKDEEKLDSERAAAKQVVRDASKMLENSNGKLDAEMWRSLFLTFALPAETNTRGHCRLTALPRRVIAHFRAATGLRVHEDRAGRPEASSGVAGKSSKVLALLADLPRQERSVVFTSGRESVLHLLTVFRQEGIGCRALFNGQSTTKSEQAVNEWESDEEDGNLPYPVLVIQVGAAASGLTLTASSKMFLMEPFLRQEEEQQALARCHRYGQQHEVHAKCYFTPVSIEERLLEWRKVAQSGVAKSTVGDTTVVVRDLSATVRMDARAGGEASSDDDVFGTDGGKDTGVTKEVAQSLYLLGMD